MPTLMRFFLLVAIALTWATAARPQAPCGSWQGVPMPNAAGHALASVSATSATDAWALWKAVYHWNGSAWTQVTAAGLVSPDPLGYADTSLAAIATVAPGDAWLVGNASFLGTPQTFVERWNGSTWSVVPSPVFAGGSLFDAVAVLDANDAWAVGIRAGGLPESQATSVTLTAHWDGSHWSVVPSPNISNRSHRLEDVVAIASDDVWAVGYSRNWTELYRTLILHWNGSSWSITPSPNFPGAENFLYGVSATSANDVWAVGEAWDGVVSRQVFLHWDGTAWSQVDGPGGPTACVGCTGDVLAMGANDVWAVGSTIGHWNGSEWSLVPNPAVPGSLGIALRSLARVGPCEAWAVGGSFDAEQESALAVRLSSGAGTVNQAPIARAAADPASGPGPVEVHFSSAGSVDPDGSIVSWRWDFGDSSDPPNRNDPNPVHTFLQTGPLTYDVSLQVKDDQGAISEASVRIQITSPLDVEPRLPRVLALRASPNPARGESVLELVMPTRESVHVTVVDPNGRRVRELWSAPLDAGEHVLRWDGRDDAGRPAGAGVYFVTAFAGGHRVTARTLRLR